MTAEALVAYMDRNDDPLRCHWKDGPEKAMVEDSEHGGLAITKGQCEIVSECRQREMIA